MVYNLLSFPAFHLSSQRSLQRTTDWPNPLEPPIQSIATYPFPLLVKLSKGLTTEPLAYIHDVVSSEETQNAAYYLLAPGGTLLVVLNPAVEEDKLSADNTVTLPFASVHLEMHREIGVEILKHLPGWFESVELKTTATEYIPGGLAAIPDAQDRLRSGQVGALKLIVHPNETA